MASHRSKSVYVIKECSTCGSLYTKDCCSKGSLNDKILVSESNSSPCCARCGTPVDGPSCRGCAFLRKKFDEDLLEYIVVEVEYPQMTFKILPNHPMKIPTLLMLFENHALSIKNPVVNVESELVESLINRDTLIVYSSKIDPILEDFGRELAHIAPIPPGIVEADFNQNDDTSSDDDDFEDIEYVSLDEVDQEEKEFDLEDILQIQDVTLREKLLNVSRLISNIESLKDNPSPVMDTIRQEETRSGSTTTHANYSLPEYESFHFDNPSLPRPPPEPPDVCLDMLYNDESFEPSGDENIVVSNVEEDDSFTFTIRTFLPFLTYPEVSPLYCSTRSEDLIFDPIRYTFHKPVVLLTKVFTLLSYKGLKLNSGIESSLRLGDKKQAASWEFTPCLSSLSSFFLSNDQPNKFFEASRVRLICPVLLELLILCEKLVWGDPYPFIIMRLSLFLCILLKWALVLVKT
ncbi:hypothetical protein Tco_0836502 [Tanacetum coccineum]